MEYPSDALVRIHSFIFLTTSFNNGMKLPALTKGPSIYENTHEEGRTTRWIIPESILASTGGLFSSLTTHQHAWKRRRRSVRDTPCCSVRKTFSIC